MAKTSPTLGHKEVTKLSSVEGMHAVGGVLGLRLRVERNLAGDGHNARWELRRKVNGKAERVGLGSFPDVSLLNARNSAREILEQAAAKGQTLKEAVAALRATAAAPDEGEHEPLFREVADRLIADREARQYWRNPRAIGHAQGWIRCYLHPVLGDMPVSAIRADDVVRALNSESVQGLTPESGKKLRALARAVFGRAVVEGLIEDNPMDGSRYRTLMAAVRASTPVKANKHRGALLPEELPEFFAQLVENIALAKECGRSNAGATALAFAILTCSRSGNVCKAEWEDFDTSAHTWTIPAHKMKTAGNGAHVVYLSAPAEQLALAAHCGHRRRVFVLRNGNPMRDDGVSLVKAIKNMNEQRKEQGLPEWIDTEQTRDLGETVYARPHGISRATFKTWTQTAEDSRGRRFIPEAVELCLHHVLKGAGGLGQAYERSKFVDERKAIYKAWAAFCLSKTPPERWAVAVG